MSILSTAMAIALLLAGTAVEAGEPQPGWNPSDPAVECAGVADEPLCADLLELRNRDQILRHRLIEDPDDPELRADLERSDAENLARLEEILAERGWPRESEVGESAAGAAWLVIQHADLATQERFLPTLEAAVETGDLEPGSLALTIDRIRVGQGRPQLYGTQFTEVDGELVPEPIEDPESVDERRAEVGLPPLAEYAALIREFYRARVKEAATPDAPDPR